jgi:hypothetical protein
LKAVFGGQESKMRNVSRIAGVAVAGLLFTACGGGTPTASTSTARATASLVATSLHRAPVVGQVPGYTPTSANEEGYWYSRYNMMSLTMQSGLGESFMPSMDQMQMAMQAVAQNPADPVMPPVNPALLQTVYAGGDPRFVTTPDPMDFGTLRWKGGPARFTVEASAWTITKEIEWAKLFHVDDHFGTPTDSFGSTQRFAGMIFASMVKMQFMALQADPGRFEPSRLGDYALLTALSDATGFYGAATMPHSTTNRYADPMAAQQFAGQAQQQFQKVLASEPEGVRELSSAIQSLVWYASITADPTERTSARAAIVTLADELSGEEAESPTARAYAIRGLIEAGRVTGDVRYLDEAAATYQALIAGFDATHGVLQGTHRLTTDGIGEIAGALNAAGLFLGDRIDQAGLTTLFGAWWEGTVNLSGFQIAAPAIPEFKGAYETSQDPLNYRYPAIPLPKDVGTPYGTAPVFAATVTYSGHRWLANQTWFDTAGAMHTSNEFIWFHNDEVNGFPDVTLP